MQEKKHALAQGIYGREEKQKSAMFSAEDLKELFAPLQ